MALDHSILFYDIPDLELETSEKDSLLAEKQVCYVGTFKKWTSATEALSFDVDEDLIDHWVATHPKLIAAGLDVPVPLKHVTDPEKRRGTVKSLYKKADKKGRISLYASIEFNTLEDKKQLTKSNVSMFVPPLVRHQDDVFIRPIRHICITDYPVIGDLEPFTIAAAYDSTVKPVKKGNSVMMRALAAKLGLDVPPDASDDAIAGMIFAKFEEIMKKDVDGDGKVGDADGAGDTSTEGKDVAASTDPMVINLVRDNRIMKIDRLISDRRIAPARAKTLKEKFAGKEISLSNDTFDSLYEELQSLDPIVALSSESSGSQKTSGEKSALVKSAESRVSK